MTMHNQHHPRPPLAIVGVGCRLPGDVSSAQQFWDLLYTATDATRVVPETRWDAARYHDADPAKVGKIVTRRGGFLDEIDQFDPQFFGMSPREAHSLDPQQRLLLAASWEALEDGGIPAAELAGTDVGVFVGGFTLDYQLLQNLGRTSRYRFKAHSATGMMMTMLANRISYALDLRGPSMTVDTACSSSLVAVHLAAQSIWNGECHLALAGGVNVMIGPNTAIAESKSGFLSPEGRSKAFDDAADGYARGEGGAIVVIKPLEAALADGDHIYAQILGTAISQDGHTDGITVPSELAQEAAIRAALDRAGIDATEIGYVEAHGTGTPVGDPIEMRALAAALTADRDAGDPLLIGSVKTNIGHLEAGAGVAGLIKAAMVLEHGYIPANLHLRTPTRHVSLADLKLDIPAAGRPFPDRARRLAGVNSFGFGGTNAHVVLAEPPAPTPVPPPDSPPLPLAVLPISARSEDALVATAQNLAAHLDAHPEITLPDLAHTLGRRRSHLNHRFTAVATDIADARDQLRALVDGGRLSIGRTGSAPPKVAFVCTGMGPQWWGMCRGLLEEFPTFRASMERTDRELSRYADWSLLAELGADEAHSRMAETEIAQPANFAVQVALAEQLAEYGVVADAVIGHSAGEVAAHHLAGLLTFEQAVHVIYHRSRLQQRTSGRGRMLAVGVDAETLLQTLDPATRDEFGRRVSVAAINSPSAVTVAGEDAVLDDIARHCEQAGIFHRRLAVKVPYHTHYMDDIKADLMTALEGLSSKAAARPLYSTVIGELLDGYQAGAAYWWQNTRATVLFEPALQRMLDDGYTHFLELGPHPVLAASILETAGTQKVSTLAAQRRDQDDTRTLLGCVGALYSHGCDLDWAALHPGGEATLVALPSYPWQTRRYWNETPEAAEALFYRPVHPLLGQPVSGVHPTWEAEISADSVAFLADHRIQGSVVVPGAVYLEMAMAAAAETYGSQHSVDNLVLHRAVILDSTCDPILRTTLNQDDGTLEFTAFTATADGDLKWYITATAELNILPAPRRRIGTSADDETVIRLTGDEFYDRTQALGFDYGPAFRSVQSVAAGHDWAQAHISVPAAVADELGEHRFHPALIDGAFHTLFGAPFLGQQASDEPFLPTAVRHCAVYGAPQAEMTVRVDVRSATREQVVSDITVTDRHGTVLAVLDGFAVQSLATSARMSAERIDKGLYQVIWRPADTPDSIGGPAHGSWLVLTDDTGVGAQVAQRLQGLGARVHTLGYRDAAQLDDLMATPELAGVVDCWPLDITAESDHGRGVFGLLAVMKSIAQHNLSSTKVFVLTADTQPVPGSAVTGVAQAPLWGLGRVIGHQEFAQQWGALIDVDLADDPAQLAERISAHLTGGGDEDQVALRGEVTYVPRLALCTGLTRPFPTKLAADATYLVTGGLGALGQVVTGYLAQRGARHITVLSRSALPPRRQWATLTEADPHRRAVSTIQAVERLGVHVETASVDVADAAQLRTWLEDHQRDGGRRIRGVVHAAGTVADQLLVNMSEDDFAAVLRPKVHGARALHDAFADRDLDFFVLFGSAGSTIAAPGQGNYAAANAYLDALAHHRRAQGLPALTIGWGPWSVGMVEELHLEDVYARRGIELITPAVGARILDRLINQPVTDVVAITADWSRARHAGLGGRLPQMFAELGAEPAPDAAAGSSLLDVLAATPEAERPAVITGQVRGLVATVFDCAVQDIEPDDILDDIGLDSMMAMDFRVRINTMFSIDLPVLEILRGVSVNSLSERVLTELRAIHGQAPAASEPVEEPDAEQMLANLSEAELRELLAELEAESGDPDAGARQT